MSAVAVQIGTPFRRWDRKTARPSLRMIAAWSLLAMSIPTLVGWSAGRLVAGGVLLGRVPLRAARAAVLGARPTAGPIAPAPPHFNR